MTTIGTAVLQIIPSLKGVSDSINKQLASTPGLGKDVGKRLGSNIADGVRGSESQISAALTQAVNRRGGEKAGKDWADSTASAMAQHLQSAQNTQKMQSSLAYLVKNGDAAGKKFARDMASNLAIELPIQTRAQQVGEKVGAVIGRSIGLGIKAASVGIVGVVGATLFKGFERLQSIDQATFKLKALGHSAVETKTIMDNALASVKGTAFSLADAATAAASAVAAGIQPGQDLTKYLSEVGDAAAVAGTSFEDMGSIFNKIQTSNKAYTDDLNQLSDKGLPIFTWLQKEYGVTADKLSDMVQKGEVDSAHFQKAINDNIGGAAQKMGQSFDGAVQNMEASVARLGANFLTAILGGPGGSALEGPTEAIGRLTTKFDEIGAWVQAHAPEIRQFFTDMVNDIKPVAEALGSITGFLIGHPDLIKAVVVAFAGWKAITTISAVKRDLEGINTTLGSLGGTAATTAGASIGSGLLAGLRSVFSIAAVALIIDQALPKSWKDWSLNNLLPSADSPLGKLVPDSVPAPPPLRPDQMIPPYGTSTGDAGKPPPPGERWIRMTSGAIASIPIGQKLPVGASEAATRAAGGPIFGNGPKGKDTVPIWAAPGEHMLTTADVDAMGGQGGVYAFRRMLHRDQGGPIPDPVDWLRKQGIVQDVNDNFNPAIKIDTSTASVAGVTDNPLYHRLLDGVAGPLGKWMPGSIPPTTFPNAGLGEGDMNWPQLLHVYAGLARPAFSTGGAVGADVSAAEKLVGTPYSMAKRFDCSGDVARVINAALGQDGGLMSTANARQWLAARGFKPGIGGPGTISVGWKNGGPGGGHMAMTLSDGRNAEGGGSHPNFLIGGAAAGASSPQFTDHMYLPIAAAPKQAEGKDTVSGQGDQTAAASPSAGPSTGASLPSAFSDLAGFGLDNLGSGVGKTSSGSDLSLFGKAAGAAVSGQVSSALGVFGAGDSPGWLKGLSTLVGGIKVGDGSSLSPLSVGQGRAGSSAAPIAATTLHHQAPTPDNATPMHGTRAGQTPGPQVVYNIRTATVEDAFLAAQRKQDERNAAKLSVY